MARLDQVTVAARGRSRMPDLVEQLKVQPIVNSAMVTDRLGVTRKTALSLIGELEEAGCLVNLTARRAARFWALPSLAKRMASAGGPATRIAAQRPASAASSDRHEPPDLAMRSGRLKDSFDATRLDRVMAELDAALEGLDDIVSNLGHAARRQERPETGPAGVD